VGFATIWVIIAVTLTGHLAGNLVTGRLGRRFVHKQWPQHDESIPYVNKLLHFQHVFSMFALGFTGLYIHFPFFHGGRTTMRYIHYVFMIIVVVNFLWRLWIAFFSKRRDYKEFAITRDDIFSAPSCALYYAFVKPSKPHLCKYNVLQKGTYILFVPLMATQAFTGFALITTPFIFGYSPRDLLVGWWLGALVGSTDLAGWYARTLHYAITWIFIILTTIHAYLCLTEDFPAVQNFFGIVKLPRRSRRERPSSGRRPSHPPWRRTPGRRRPEQAPRQAPGPARVQPPPADPERREERPLQPQRAGGTPTDEAP
jgi:Ni/Fe-hydrogenase 1 B-type cytochrome subunit